MNYEDFIASKRRTAKPLGFEPTEMNPRLFDWQATVIGWAVRRGRAALFEECGLGKTLQQLEWARQVHQHTGGNVLIHSPVGVRHQTVREAEKFEIDAPVYLLDDMGDLRPGIAICNYEKLHKLDTSQFVGVVLDESSILKGIAGKTKRALVAKWADAPYRLCCTATPAPNDYMELGNHAEFLGVCEYSDMLNRFFVHDSGDTSKWRLRKHAVQDFWRWMSSWSVCIERPSDIGYSDDGYELPPLNRFDHFVDIEFEPSDGFLFATGIASATSIHGEKRKTADARAAKAAEVVLTAPDEPWLIWCDTNYEADALLRHIPSATEIRGSESESSKEAKLKAFTEGRCKRLITKPRIAGFGMNWQHCRNVMFIGLSYSYEQFYQAVRRTWRFGQSEDVNVHVIATATEESVARAIERKMRDHESMKHNAAVAMRDFTSCELAGDRPKEKYTAKVKTLLPSFI